MDYKRMVDGSYNMFDLLCELLTPSIKASKELLSTMDKYRMSLSYYLSKVKSDNNKRMVYFILNEATGLIKIGKTKDVSKRIKSLRAAAYQLLLELLN